MSGAELASFSQFLKSPVASNLRFVIRVIVIRVIRVIGIGVTRVIGAIVIKDIVPGFWQVMTLNSGTNAFLAIVDSYGIVELVTLLGSHDYIVAPALNLDILEFLANSRADVPN